MKLLTDDPYLAIGVSTGAEASESEASFQLLSLVDTLSWFFWEDLARTEVFGGVTECPPVDHNTDPTTQNRTNFDLFLPLLLFAHIKVCCLMKRFPSYLLVYAPASLLVCAAQIKKGYRKFALKYHPDKTLNKTGVLFTIIQVCSFVGEPVG